MHVNLLCICGVSTNQTMSHTLDEECRFADNSTREEAGLPAGVRVPQLELKDVAVLVTQDVNLSDKDDGGGDIRTTCGFVQEEENQGKEMASNECNLSEKMQPNSNMGTLQAEEGTAEKFAGDEALGCACKKQCWSMFTFEEIQQIYKNFWAMSSNEDKRLWLQKHVGGRSNSDDTPLPRHRGLYKKYQLPSKKICSMVKVCSTFFKSSLGLSTLVFLQILAGDYQGEQNLKSRSQNKQTSRDGKDSSRNKKNSSNTTGSEQNIPLPCHASTDVLIDNAEDNNHGVKRLPYDASNESDELDTLEICFDLGDQIAALYTKQAFRKHPKLMRDIPEEKRTDLILQSFNKSYPIHTMEMTHFLPIYYRVFKKFKRKSSGSSADAEDSLIDKREDEMNSTFDSECESESNSDNHETETFHSQQIICDKYSAQGNFASSLPVCSDLTFSGQENPSRQVRRQSTRSTRMTGIMNEKLMSKLGSIGTRLKQARRDQQETQIDPASSGLLCTKSAAKEKVSEREQHVTSNEQKIFTSGSSSSAHLLNQSSGKLDSVAEKHSPGIRNRVKRLKQYALRIKTRACKKITKENDEIERHRTFSTKASTLNYHKKARRDELKVLRYKHKHPLLPVCKCTRRNCSLKIPEHQRLVIHDMFWSMVSVHDRKAWLLKFIERLKPAENIVSYFHQKKYVTKRYFLPDSYGMRVEVCRLFFIHTLGFKWDSVIDHIVRSKLPVNSSPQCPPKKVSRYLPQNIIESVERYIQSIEDPEKVIRGDHSSVEMEPEANRSSIEHRSLLKCSVDSSPAVKLKALYLDYRKKHKSLRFNLGYHSFRRICDSVLYQSQPPSSIDGECCKDTEPHRHSGSESSGINTNILSLKTHSDKNKSNLEDLSSKEDHNLKDICAKPEEQEAPSSLIDSPSSCHESDTDNCILDVRSGIFKMSKANNICVPKPIPLKLKSTPQNYRPLSQLNDKSHRPVLPPCKCSKRKCFEKFTEQWRKEINEKFWSLPGYNERKQWLNEHLKRDDVKRRRVGPSKGVFKKTETRTYILPDLGGSSVEVCRIFFLRTLGYKWDRIINTLRRTTGKDDKIVPPDMRGRKTPSNKISEEMVASMIKYCESVCLTHLKLYKMKSQESAARLGKPVMLGSLRKYGLTVLQLYKDYKTKHPDHKSSYTSFSNVFKQVHSAVVLPDSPRSVDLRDIENKLVLDERDYSPSVDQEIAISSVCDSPDELSLGSRIEEFSTDSPSQSDLNQQMSLSLHEDGSDFEVSDNCNVQFQECSSLPVSSHLGVGGHNNQDKSENIRAILGHELLNPSHQNFAHAHGNRTESNIHFSRNKDDDLRCEQKFFHESNVKESNSRNYTSSVSAEPGTQFLDRINEEPFNYPSRGTDITQHSENSSSCPVESTIFSGQEENQVSCDHSVNQLGQGFEYSKQNTFPSVHQLINRYSSNPIQQFVHQAHCMTDTNFTSPNSQCPHNALQSNQKISNEVGPHALMHSHFNTGKVNRATKATAVGGNPAEEQSRRAKEHPRMSEVKCGKFKSVRNLGSTYPMLPPCNCNRLKCVDKFPEESRQIIHDLFWSLDSYNDRKQWVLLHIRRIDCKRRRVDRPESSRKTETRYYYLPKPGINGEVVEVCKPFFLRTLGYKWDSIIDTIRKTTPKGERVSKPDQRGKKSPLHKLSETVTCSVIAYVKSMWQAAEANDCCTVDSDIGGSQRLKARPFNAQQIPYGVTMRDLYNDYKAKHAGHKISYESFRKIYKTTDFDAVDMSVVEDAGSTFCLSP